MENQLVKVVNESGLDKTKAQVLLDNFSNYFDIAADWENKAKTLAVTDVKQIAEMKMAREGRLFLKQKRVDVEHTRKMLKENALREGQTIDSIARILTNLILPIEQDLEQKEKFAEIQEAKRKAELKAIREQELQPYIEYVPFGIDLGALDEAGYQTILNGAKMQLQAKIDAEQKAEDERIAKEKAEAEERERIRQENERLKKEAEERERLAKIERDRIEKEREEERRKQAEAMEKQRKEAEEKARIEKEKQDKIQAEFKAKAEAERKANEAKLKAEREEKQRLQAELEAKAEAERKEAARVATEKKAKEEAERKAANAPDKEKLISAISALTFNVSLKSDQAQIISKVITEKFEAFKKWAIQQTESL